MACLRSYHVVRLARIGLQIVQLRQAILWAVEQTPLTGSNGSYGVDLRGDGAGCPQSALGRQDWRREYC